MGFFAELASSHSALGQAVTSLLQAGSDVAAVSWSIMAQSIDQLAEENRANAEAMLADGPDLASSGFNPWIWGLVALGVLLLCLVVGYHYRRNRLNQDEEIDNPLFDDQYEVRDEDELIIESADGRLAEVIIEEADDDLEKVDMTPRSLFGDEMPEIEEAAEEAEVVLETQEGEEAPLSSQEEVEQDDATDEEAEEVTPQAAENIFAFRQRELQKAQEAEAQPEAMVASVQASEPAVQQAAEEERKVRFASAAYKPASISFSDIRDEEPPASKETAVNEEADKHGRPYMTWYAREDMERAEQRQHDRLDKLQQQISSLRSEQTSRLDLVINALDKKLERIAHSSSVAPKVTSGDEAMSRDIVNRLSSLSGIVETQTQRLRAITQILDDRLGTVSHVYNEVRTVSERIDKLSENINKLENNIADRASHDVMADVQLSDVVRSSLPPDSYEFKHLLANNHRADCIVRLPHPPGAIVIDTRFPLDAFNALPSQEAVAKNLPQAKAAEDAFRRAALRHIIDVAERFIIPGETADSALLFLPTEAIYTTLHSRFPDVVRDSFRARVWLVSPSTLMGTLQTLRGVLRDSRNREADDKSRRETEAMKTEMEALRSRASMLAQNFEATQAELRSLLEATDKVFTKPAAEQKKPAPSRGHDVLREQLYSGTPEWLDEDNYYPGDPPSLFRDKKPPSDNLR